MKWVVIFAALGMMSAFSVMILDIIRVAIPPHKRKFLLKGYARIVEQYVTPAIKKAKARILRELRRKGLTKQRLIGPTGNATTVEALLKGVPQGWRPIVSALIHELQGTGLWDGYVRRLGQHLGILDFKIGAAQNQIPELQSLIYAAVERSAATCNQCGKEGRVAGKHELQARCKKHREEEA